MSDLRTDLIADLAAFGSKPLSAAARAFFKTLGYQSDRTLPVGSVDAFCRQFDSEGRLDHPSAMKSEWRSIHLLFQLTDQELSKQNPLFKNTSIQKGLFESYIFFALELTGGDYPRSKLTGIARQLNRVFPMPVMVLIKHLTDKRPVLSIAVINRRQHKRDDAKDVLGKVTIIRDISLTAPHRGHLDILASLTLSNLVHPQKKPIIDFDTLHVAWEQIFNVELLNERFYRELANWYFWALPQVDFPADLEPDSEKRRATGLIRLLTRLIFCWFLKEKSLIPEKLFHQTDVEGLLTDLDDDGSSYYQAILQNLFFATLNQRMGKDAKGKSYRFFAKDEGFLKNRETYDVNNLYRYESLFRAPDSALSHFEDIPFLNGGLFECLDRTDDDTEKKRYVDGFSRNAKKRPTIPNRLFFGGEETVNLADIYGDNKRKAEKVSGLIRILNRYKFTIVENTPIDQEIALDPELLGKVFENLLASYNEETKTTARKQTGSFYTPRSIVDYMVDESLKAHLTRILVGKAGMKEPDARAGLDLLFTYTERAHAFSTSEVACLIAAIDALKILDPACGSGAFPMGALHKLVYILGKLDPDNERWKQTQLAKLDSAPMREELDRAFSDNNDDYGRKLYLIENCLYGVDIQPIAIQITKLRFFISLVCDQKTNRSKKDNHGIRPLPNLETKFVAANSLIGLPEMTQSLLVDPRVGLIEKEIESLYHSHFSIQRRDQKLKLQREIKVLRKELAKLLAESLMSPAKAKHIAEWDPFDPQSCADFFDPHWMFGAALTEGFDIVIQNPPYISHEKLTPSIKAAIAGYDCWEPFADVYCYFIERAMRLLRTNGFSCSITSNSFLRADYGGPLRSVIAKNCAVHSLISIDKSQVFQNAIVNVAILLFSKDREQADAYRGCRASWEAGDFDEHVRINSFECASSSLRRGVWSLSTNAELEILRQIEAGQRSLADRNAKIRLGLATGSNDAFLIPREMRDRFVRLDERNAAILKPVIRGRDVDRYQLTPIDQFLILSKNGVNLPQEYPLLADHLKSFGSTFTSRGAQGENWWNLRACSFYDDFEQDRVVWIEMTNNPRFAVCPAGVYMLNTAYFLLPPPEWRAYALVALLNSSVSAFFMKHSAQTSGMGVTRWFKEHVSQIPIPGASKPAEDILFTLGWMRSRFADTEAPFLEDLIDACVMECYFHEHMAEHDLLFHATLAPHLASYDPEASEAEQREFITNLYQTLNAPSHAIRNRLLRLTVDSPGVLAVIKSEGQV